MSLPFPFSIDWRFPLWRNEGTIIAWNCTMHHPRLHTSLTSDCRGNHDIPLEKTERWAGNADSRPRQQAREQDQGSSLDLFLIGFSHGTTKSAVERIQHRPSNGASANGFCRHTTTSQTGSRPSGLFGCALTSRFDAVSHSAKGIPACPHAVSDISMPTLRQNILHGAFAHLPTRAESRHVGRA